jgi:26S proteasome regulatory subunit N13
MSEPSLKLVMIAGDGQFMPYNHKKYDPTRKSYTNGRIFVLKFQSSTQRHLFWLQSKSQDPNGDPAYFSQRDLKIGWMVDRLLQGDDVNVEQEVAEIGNDQGGEEGDDSMEDVAPEEHGDIQGNIASGDPFMGDPENEGEESREGGADGGRA